MGFRATNGEVAARVHQIKEMLIDGFTRYEILQFVREKYGRKAKMGDLYMARARAEIADEYRPVREYELQKHIKRREKFMRKMADEKEHALYLKAEDGLEKLKGLLIDKIEMNDTTDPAEVAKIFGALVSAAGTGQATQDNNPIPSGDSPLQNSPRGPQVV